MSSTIASDTLLLGRDVEYSKWGSTDTEYLGEITEIGGVENLVTIEKELADPFYSKTVEMEFDKFCDWWERPNPSRRGRATINEEEDIILVI